MESDNEDCGIDGPEGDVVTNGKLNRLVRRVLHGHVLPNYKRVAEIQAWMKDKDSTIDKITGGLFVLRMMLWVIGILIVATFGGTVWVMMQIMQRIP